MVTPQHSSLTTPFRDDKRIRFQCVVSQVTLKNGLRCGGCSSTRVPLASGDSSVWGNAVRFKVRPNGAWPLQELCTSKS